MADGVIIAAASSNAGKSVVTLALARAFTDAGIKVASAKVGPDYIDPRFHAAATRRDCLNLDPWAMRPALVHALAGDLSGASDLVLVEGVMGLFDGAAAGAGSTADLAAQLALPVILVVDCSRQAQSIAALARGFRDHRKDIDLAGVILNRVASPRHRSLLEEALAATGIETLGAMTRLDDLATPSRHLGLVQACEIDDLEDFIAAAAKEAAANVALERVHGLARPLPIVDPPATSAIDPPGQRIALASDEAFGFFYPHLARAWRRAGAELHTFSPLADEAPAGDADAVFLPGGYPELHAGRLAANDNFIAGLRHAAQTGKTVYGECGGYMVLGEAIIDADGHAHPMTGLLPVETSFAERRLHLGYRRLTARAGWLAHRRLRGHEFHYTTARVSGPADALFTAADSGDNPLADMGLARANVSGSYAHIIDLEE